MVKNSYICLNSNIILNLLNYIIDKSKKKEKKNLCPICNREYNYKFTYVFKNLKINIEEHEVHLLQIHNVINVSTYKSICSHKINGFHIEWFLMSSNDINMIDGLYENGSNQIYAEKNKNISKSEILRFSEHNGFIYFDKNKISNITVLTNSRIDKSDPMIYMPKNCLEALNVDYLYHTHPKTPYIGSRINNGIIYEFPSISDIIHFIEHHNNGKLLGSLVLAPEGMYVIRKNIFDRKKISVDYDVMIPDIENIFLKCYNDSYTKYSILDYENLKINDNIKLPNNYFYEHIAINYNYINRINEVLKKYNLYIDYYARIYNKVDIDKWILDDIYVPFVN